jgi:thymidine kinase
VKRCFRCGLSKASDQFNRSSKNRDGLQAYCRDCHKDHYRANYARHLRNVRRTSKARISRLRRITFEAMAAGCVDCGNRDIRVLEFDHVRGEKVATIGQMIRIGASAAALVAEIQKCEVRCSNCHAIATYARLGHSWHDEFLN